MLKYWLVYLKKADVTDLQTSNFTDSFWNKFKNCKNLSFCSKAFIFKVCNLFSNVKKYLPLKIKCWNRLNKLKFSTQLIEVDYKIFQNFDQAVYV